MNISYKKGDRVREPIRYGAGLVRYNEGTVLQGNIRGAKVQFDDRTLPRWMPARSIAPMALPAEQEEPMRQHQPVVEPMPEPMKPKPNQLIEDLKSKSLDPWEMFVALRDALKSQLVHETQEAEQIVIDTAQDLFDAEGLLTDARQKHNMAKENLAAVKRRAEELIKRVV